MIIENQYNEIIETIINVINQAKNKNDLNGAFYNNGWKDACDYILNKINNDSFNS